MDLMIFLGKSAKYERMVIKLCLVHGFREEKEKKILEEKKMLFVWQIRKTIWKIEWKIKSHEK